MIIGEGPWARFHSAFPPSDVQTRVANAGIVDEFRFGPESSPWPLGHRGFKFPVDAELLAFFLVLAY